MDIHDYIGNQLREALGPVNKWYCSQHYRREVTDPETLLRYYISHGGAAQFAKLHAAESVVGSPARRESFDTRLCGAGAAM